MALPNPERGEVAIRLAGKDFIMRPTFQALVEIEQSTGQGIILLARRFAMGAFGIGDATAIITAGLKAAGEPATMEKVGPMVFKAGITSPDIASAINTFLENALTGGAQLSGEAGPEGEATATATPSGTSTD